MTDQVKQLQEVQTELLQAATRLAKVKAEAAEEAMQQLVNAENTPDRLAWAHAIASLTKGDTNG